MALLSTGKESALLRHLMPKLSLSTNVPCHRRKPDYNSPHDGRVRLPIRWLCIPSSGWRPDMLRISEDGDLACSIGRGRLISCLLRRVHSRYLSTTALRDGGSLGCASLDGFICFHDSN